VITDKPVVVVRWNDAQSSATKVYTEGDPSYHAPVVMETLGWLLKDDEAGVSIMNEVFAEEGVKNYRGHTFVPRSLIIEVIPFAGQPRKKRVKRAEEKGPSAD
jgi:hypothetical protein